MILPEEATWVRVQELAEEMDALPPERIGERMSELAAAGEGTTVLTLLSTWLALPPPPSGLNEGTLLGGRYVLRQKLGEGGMGSVWRASQELIGREVAVKIIHPSLVTPGFQARFEGEMRVLGQLDHPGIVRIFDAGLHRPPQGAAIPFFAMELIEGWSLERWAAPRRGQPVELLRAVSGICAALGSAHERQIVHRDLKPSNILVRKNGQPVIVDFGIARLRGLLLGQEEGLFSGTPQYAAPEQHLGRDHDFRSGESVDIYAVGAILFEVLSGRRLFEFPRGASIAEMRRAVLAGSPSPLSEVVEGCPPALEEIVSRAVRRDPADRFYSIGALGRAIDRVAALIATPESAGSRWVPAPRAVIPGTSWALVEKLGEGGAGEVWVGAHRQLGERRVFKFCDTEEKARTLKREVTLFRLLKEKVGRNPHFITLHEVALDEPPWYLMMDYIEAGDLEAWCGAQDGGLEAIPEAKCLEIVIQAAEALQAAHEAGILHRDIKPANLLVREAGADLHVFIADFGIGQIVSEQLLRESTRLGFTRTVSELRSGLLSGTLLYLAPEVVGGGPATARSDIYSLGVVLWQLMAKNLRAALDPADWPTHISDPILREHLHRCLAGAPARRWASAGELAAHLRALPEQRLAEARRRAELAARERAAYRRGIVRTAVVAVVLLAVVTGLAFLAFVQRREAERAHGEIAREQAEALPRADLRAGRRQRGLDLLELAAKTGADIPALRTAAAVVFGLTDLVAVPLTNRPPAPPVVPLVHERPGEVARALSPDGTILAVARDLDGLNGTIDLFEAASGALRHTIARKDFPWVPVAQTNMLCFSPDSRTVAIGGAATSRQVLFFDATNAALRAYLFQGSDPLCIAWHPGGRFFATGGADGNIRIWDVAAAAISRQPGAAGNQFALPPALDAPALDFPVNVLEGQRGPVKHLVFGTDGGWLAALDQGGYLRIFSGFPPVRTGQVLSGKPVVGFPDAVASRPTLTVERRLEKPEELSGLSALAESLMVEREPKSGEEFRLVSGCLPEELQLAPALAGLAWNDAQGDLCATTLTDVHWVHAAPLRLRFSAGGQNPFAVSWDARDRCWLLPTQTNLDFIQLGARAGVPRAEKIASFPLIAAIEGQGARAALATARDGRTAVYYGRRIQFFSPNAPTPRGPSIVANGGGGDFQDLLWDTAGQLLGAAFVFPTKALRLESWKTSRDFPPKCDQLSPAASLEATRVVPANDGRSFIARGPGRGLVQYTPATAAERVIDGSNEAQQDAALACSSDGAWLAAVVDRDTLRILRLPGGNHFADLRSPRATRITLLRWDSSGSRLAGLTEDGFVRVWNLAPWQEWLAAHHLDR